MPNNSVYGIFGIHLVGSFYTDSNIWIATGGLTDGMFIEWKMAVDNTTFQPPPLTGTPGQLQSNAGSWFAGLYDNGVVNGVGQLNTPGTSNRNLFGFMEFNNFPWQTAEVPNPYSLLCISRNSTSGSDDFAPTGGIGWEYADNSYLPGGSDPIFIDNKFHTYSMRIEKNPGSGVHQIDYYLDGNGVATFSISQFMPDPTVVYNFAASVAGDFNNTRSLQLASVYAEWNVN